MTTHDDDRCSFRFVHREPAAGCAGDSRNPDEVLAAAQRFDARIREDREIAGSYSSLATAAADVGGLLVQQGFDQGAFLARRIAKWIEAPSFQNFTAFRFGSGGLQPLGPEGKLQSAGLIDAASAAMKVGTVGEVLALRREATSTNLPAAYVALAGMKDPGGQLSMARPAFVLVPPTLAYPATVLFAGIPADERPAVVSSPMLEDAAIAGSSTAAGTRSRIRAWGCRLTGWRRSEIARLRPQDVDLEQASALVHGKARDQRVRLHPEAVVTLRRLFEHAVEAEKQAMAESDKGKAALDPTAPLVAALAEGSADRTRKASPETRVSLATARPVDRGL